MAEQEDTKKTRKSHCSNCGKRLSFQTPFGEIGWRTCHVDDKGIYCETCFAEKKPDKMGEEA